MNETVYSEHPSILKPASSEDDRGLLAELAFVKAARAAGYTVTYTTPREDYLTHCDFRVSLGAQDQDGDKEDAGMGVTQTTQTVDVKARRRFRRSDPLSTDSGAPEEDELIWLETHGRRHGDPGWLFAGHMDLLALETEGSFWLLDRKRVADILQDPKGPVDMTRPHVFQPVEGRIYARGAAMGHGSHDAVVSLRLGQLTEHRPDALVRRIPKVTTI